MTALAEAPDRAAAPRPTAAPSGTSPAAPPDDVVAGGISVGRLVAAWILITVVGVVLVVVNIGPITAERDQRALLAEYREEIESASNQAFGLAGVEVPTEAPSRGAPVAILDIPGLRLRQVVVEGTGSEETRTGPGHVVGTGGPGQPGNSVIVGRETLFGGPFGDLDDVDEGDRIVVSTTQGQSVYVVEAVGTREIIAGDADAEAAPTTSTTLSVVDPAIAAETGEAEAAPEVDLLPDGPLTVEQLYGATADDRLTLVTSASGVPWATDEATVVVARLDSVPFAPTPQGGRTTEDDGRGGDDGVLAALGLALVAYVVTVVGAVWLHRNVPWRSAYLLTAPLLVALTIVIGEQLALALPAWS